MIEIVKYIKSLSILIHQSSYSIESILSAHPITMKCFHINYSDYIDFKLVKICKDSSLIRFFSINQRDSLYFLFFIY